MNYECQHIKLSSGKDGSVLTQKEIELLEEAGKEIPRHLKNLFSSINEYDAIAFTLWSNVQSQVIYNPVTGVPVALIHSEVWREIERLRIPEYLREWCFDVVVSIGSRTFGARLEAVLESMENKDNGKHNKT